MKKEEKKTKKDSAKLANETIEKNLFL